MTIAVPTWTPPWPASAPTYVRVSNSHLRPGGCPEQIARKARPDLFPDEQAPRQGEGIGSFPLGLVRDAALLLLAPTAPQVGEPGERVAAAIAAAADASWDEWVADSIPAVMEGLVGYLEVLESLRAEGLLPESRVVPDLAVVQDPEGDRIEFWTWAIHHIALDGSVRETHLLRWRTARAVALGGPETALIAQVAAAGAVVEHPKWWRRFELAKGLTQPPAPQRVRVRVVGLLDRSTDVRFDGTAQEAQAGFQADVPSALGALAGGTFLPGTGCAGCAIRHVCPGLPRLPGLLGVTGYAPRTRSVSPAALWRHSACPRQLFLSRDLGLPAEPSEPGPALVRGTQVHEWLATAHARGRACDVDDLPEPSAEPSGDAIHAGLGWSAQEYATNRPYLLQHVGHCPLDDVAARDLVAEVPITAWDTDANVVYTSRVDTAWVDGDGRWRLRETKTLSPRNLPADPTVLLERYPQVAAAVCLLADGWTPDGSAPDQPARKGVAELELLGPEDGRVLEFDAADPITVLVARTALADRVDAWLFDDEHPVGVHPPCRSCEVFRWCGASPDSAVEQVTEEMLPAAVDREWSAMATDHELVAIAGSDDVEEFPF